LVTRFDKKSCRPPRRIRHRETAEQRKNATRRGGHIGYLGRAQREGRQGRAAATCIRCSGSRIVYRVREPDELLERGVFDAQEYRTFRRARISCWSVRCNLHFFAAVPKSGCPSTMQREIAVRPRLHLASRHAGRRALHEALFPGRERRRDLTAILCAKLEDEQAKPARCEPHGGKFRPSTKRRRGADSDDFHHRHNRINLAAPDVFKHDPVNLIRSSAGAEDGLAFHPDAMRTVTRSLSGQLAASRIPRPTGCSWEILTSNICRGRAAAQ